MILGFTLTSRRLPEILPSNEAHRGEKARALPLHSRIAQLFLQLLLVMNVKGLRPHSTTL